MIKPGIELTKKQQKKIADLNEEMKFLEAERGVKELRDKVKAKRKEICGDQKSFIEWIFDQFKSIIIRK